MAATSALALVLVGCGGSPEQELAKELCETLEALNDGDMTVLADLEDFDQRFDEAEFSDADFDAALRSECSGLMDMFGDF